MAGSEVRSGGHQHWLNSPAQLCVCSRLPPNFRADQGLLGQVKKTVDAESEDS